MYKHLLHSVHAEDDKSSWKCEAGSHSHRQKQNRWRQVAALGTGLHLDHQLLSMPDLTLLDTLTLLWH